MLADGFLAASRSQEPACKTEQISVLVAMEDITGRISAATQGLDDSAANAARKKELTRLEQACEEASKKMTSAPEPSPANRFRSTRAASTSSTSTSAIAISVWCLPSRTISPPLAAIRTTSSSRAYCLDMSLMRAYENGKPASTPNYLKVNFAGPEAGEPVFVTGHPGNTQRLLTVDQLVSNRNAYLPLWLLRYAELRGRLHSVQQD